MTTLFERINAIIYPFETVSEKQRSQIGKKVINHFKEAHPDHERLSKQTFTNEKGTFHVTVYPDWFAPEMDAIIAQELAPKSIPKVAEIKAEPPPKRQRKRIPIGPTPVKSYKVSTAS